MRKAKAISALLLAASIILTCFGCGSPDETQTGDGTGTETQETSRSTEAAETTGAADTETNEPITDAPGTDEPETDAPTTDAPTTDAPTTDAPTTDAPTTDAPTTDAPTTDVPTTDAPETEAPHTHTWGAWAVTRSASCESAGSRERKCSGCGARETESIAATGHSWGSWSESRRPTLDAEGEETRKCSRCGKSERRGTGTLKVRWDGDTSSWMAKLPDYLSLADITIPGTHDSGSQRGLDGLMPGISIGQCQSLSIGEQLGAGVRFLDIRLKLRDGALSVYHGIVDMDLTFDEVVASCADFLAAHPGEVVIMSVKEEDDSAAGFGDAVASKIRSGGALWYTQNRLPTLGEARGKIVLLARCDADGLGINCRSGWADNRAFDMNNGVPMRVQDHYSLGDSAGIETKWTEVRDLINFAHSSGRAGRFCLNFTSGYTGMLGVTDVSNVINPRLVEYARSAGIGCYGTFACDFITADMASALAALNFTK